MVVAPLTADQVAAWEDALIGEVVRASGIIDAIGADGWAVVVEQMRSALAKAFEDAGVADASPRTASIADGPPRTAAGGAAVGLAVGPASALVGSTLRDPSGSLTNSDVDATSTSERTVNGQREVATTTMRIATTLANGRISATVEFGVDVTTYDTATGQQTGTMSYHSSGTIDMDLCPDASGQIRGHVSMALRGNTASAGSMDMTVDAEVIGEVGDDAYLHSVEAEGSTSETTTTTSQGTRSSTVSGSMSGPVSRSGGYTAEDMTMQGQVDAETGQPMTHAEVTDRFEAIGTAISVAVSEIADKAQEQWRGGACVEIRSTERSRDVAVNELVQFEAKVFHKIEQVELTKPIAPAFAGEASLDPVDIPVPSPVLLSYKAAARVDRTGTVTLTSTSNRGIATLDITFRTRANGWKVDQPSGGGRLLGQHCGDPPGEWKVDGTYEVAGMKGKQRWVFTIDANGSTGTYTYETTSKGRPGGSPVMVFTEGNAKGTVAFSIDPDDGGAVMQLQETKHTYRSWTELQGGEGSADPAALESSIMLWEVDPSC